MKQKGNLEESNMKPKVVIIAGPTASGKTGLSIKLAKIDVYILYVKMLKKP